MRSGRAAALAVLGLVALATAMVAVVGTQLAGPSSEGEDVETVGGPYQYGRIEDDAESADAGYSALMWGDDGPAVEDELQDAPAEGGSQGAAAEDELHDAPAEGESQNAVIEGEVQGASFDAPFPPLASAQRWRFGSYRKSGIQESWVYEADGEVSSLAIAVLQDLEAGHAVLVESGYLDLNETAWGCACELPDKQGSLAVTIMMPRMSRSDQSDDATRVRIVCYSAHELEEAMSA